MIDGLAIVRRYLQARGRRITPQREAIVRRMLALRGRHLSADRFATEITRSGARVSKATLYRTLSLLTQCGLFEEVDLGGRGKRYEPAIGQDHHDHLTCMRCGTIVEFLNEALERAQEDVARAHGYVNMSHSVRIYGLCPKCARSWRRERGSGLPASAPSELRRGSPKRVARLRVAVAAAFRLRPLGSGETPPKLARGERRRAAAQARRRPAGPERSRGTAPRRRR